MRRWLHPSIIIREVIFIATTRIIPMHETKGKTIAQCLLERIEYGMNPEKTQNHELISSYACEPRTADAEFFASKKQYEQIAGRYESSNVIAYQVRQSFLPGEVSPEEANQIGYDFAMRFLKGKHAFLVCTHTDKHHIHNHIYWNSTTLDCSRKFRNFWGSTKAIARLSDLICTEHQLSVIANPQKGNTSYNKWLGSKAKPSKRDFLRMAIDEALAQKPTDFDAFLSLLAEEGYRVKRGKHLSFSHDEFKQNVRMDSLGEGYTEDEIRAVLQGQKQHTPKKRRANQPQRPQTIIDIQAKLAEGKGEAYRRWATVENLKRMAKTKLYLDEHRLDYSGLSNRKTDLSKKEAQLTVNINQAQKRLTEINVLKTHIINYTKTKDVYVAYRKAGYSKKFLDEHEEDIVIHKAAKKAFDELGLKKLPTVKSLQVEFADLLTAKKAAYAERKKVRDELRELSIHKANYEELRDLVNREEGTRSEYGRD